MMTTNIAYRLPGVLAEKIINLRHTYGLTTDNLSDTKIILKNNPHFSIIPSFYINDDNQFISKLNNISLYPFELKIRFLEVFKTRFGNTVVAIIEPSDTLRRIQKEIDSELAAVIESKYPEFEGDNYNHHVTFGYNVPLDQLQKFKESANRILPMEFSVDKLEVLKTVDEQTDERKKLFMIK